MERKKGRREVSGEERREEREEGEEGGEWRGG